MTKITTGQLKIVSYLSKTGLKRNIGQIAKHVGVSFPTAKKYLDDLVTRKVLKKTKKKTNTFIGFEYLYSFDKEEHVKRKKRIQSKKFNKK